MCTHLAKRGSTYYYRRKTPIDLIEMFGKEVMVSLKTKDRKLAESLVRKMGAHYDDLFLSAAAKLAGTLTMSELTPTPQPAQNMQPKLHKELGIEDSETYAFLYQKRLRILREKAIQTKEGWLKFNDFLDKLIDGTEEYLSTGIHPLEDNPRPMWQLEAELKAATALRENTTLPFTDSMFTSTKEIVNKVTTISNDYLSELISKWAAERTPSPKTIDKIKRVVNKFDNVVGKLPITDIKKSHVVSFKDALLAGGFTTANTNQYLTELSTLLSYAVNQALIDINPATGTKIRTNESARESRRPFDVNALNAIFSSPIYSMHDRPKGGKGEAAYWLPLLALYTGARLDELCQLRVKDVQQESYQDEHDITHFTWILSITDEGEGQKLKNAGSRRRIPIHQSLLERGFVEYVQAQTATQVFPELKPALAYGSLSGNWSKWFGRYLRETIKVTDTKMVFHSFRHNFKDFARNAGIPSDVHNALTGHSSGNVADNYGSELYPLKPLVQAINRYKVVGIALHVLGIRE